MPRTAINEVNRGTGRAPVSETFALTRGDLAAIVAATVKALRESAHPAQQPAIPTPAPSPLTPADNRGDQGDPWASRANQLLGSFGKKPQRSYSLSDLVGGDDADDVAARERVANRDRLFSGRPIG